jgi:hypothetical protein
MDGKYTKLFKYDSPAPLLCRVFLLDMNGDDEPLSGKLMSFRSEDVNTSAATILMTIFTLYGEFRYVARIMEAMTNKNNYIALSYSWGETAEQHPLWMSTISSKLDRSRKDRNDRERIIMDHEPDRNGYLMIGSNLRDFLLEFRKRRISQFLWVDAICIDQASDEDKNIQIPLMRYFYESAEAVHVWLGDATPMEKGALRILPAITKKLNSIESAVMEHGVKPSVEEFLERQELPPPDHHIWVSLASILSRSWWNRLWVRLMLHKRSSIYPKIPLDITRSCYGENASRTAGG